MELIIITPEELRKIIKEMSLFKYKEIITDT